MPHQRLRHAPVLLALAVTCLTSPALANEAALRALWQGAWVVTDIATYSSCRGAYTNNEVRGRLVSSRASTRFEPGELASVHKVNLKRKQVEVLLDLVEPVLEPRRDGPFTLYDELHCRVELEIRLPAGVAGRDTRAVDGLVSGVLERHENLASAQASDSWNRRLRKPYPADYDRTLSEHEAWRVAQVNAAVQTRIEDSLEEAARLVDRLGDDPLFLEGFAAGIDQARHEHLSTSCDRLLSASESSFVDRGPGEQGRKWRDGYREGQRLVFFLEIGSNLTKCFLPPPPP